MQLLNITMKNNLRYFFFFIWKIFIERKTNNYELAAVKAETICLAARHLQKKQDALAIDSMQHNLRVLNNKTAYTSQFHAKIISLEFSSTT